MDFKDLGGKAMSAKEKKIARIVCWVLVIATVLGVGATLISSLF